MFDLILRGGRVIDPAEGTDRTADVGFTDGRVAAVEPRIETDARDIRDVSGCIVTPGLVDLHTHVYWGGTSMGLDPVITARASGTTTLVDAGSAGAANFHGFRKHIVEPAPIRILPYINLAFPGIYAYSKAVMVGECGDLRLLHMGECARVIEENKDLIVGVKVRVGAVAGGSSGIAPLDMALEVAEETGLPVMAHIDNPPPSRKEVVSRLRAGDILTHCFRPFPNAPVRSDGEIWEEILLARERGVIFDIGHGGASFGFSVAERMLARGFLPDVISSDVHALNVDGPVYDLPTTLSKFYCLGVDLPDLIRAVTVAPAKALRRSDIGTLAAGTFGEATVLRLEEGNFDYQDAAGATMNGRHRIAVQGMVLGGQWWDR